jgi:hypothetical protein
MSSLLAAAALTAGYALSGRWLWAVVFALLGFLWLAGQRRDWEATTSIMLFLFVVGCVNGINQGVATPWLLVGLVTALSAWDLDHFTRKLRKAEQIDEVRVLEQRHLRRLLIVDGLSLLLAALALTIRVEIPFGLALILGLLAVLGISQAVGFLRQARRSSEE